MGQRGVASTDIISLYDKSDKSQLRLFPRRLPLFTLRQPLHVTKFDFCTPAYSIDDSWRFFGVYHTFTMVGICEFSNCLWWYCDISYNSCFS